MTHALPTAGAVAAVVIAVAYCLFLFLVVVLYATVKRIRCSRQRVSFIDLTGIPPHLVPIGLMMRDTATGELLAVDLETPIAAAEQITREAAAR